MKTKYYYSSAIILALSLAGCSDNELVESAPSGEAGQIVHVSAVTGSDTRVSIDDDDSRLTFTWEANDKFTVFNGNQATEFTLDNGAGEQAADFVGQPTVAYNEGEQLIAVFNKNADASNSYSLDADGNMLLDLSNQDGQLTDKYQYLMAKSTYDSGSGNVKFVFENLVSVLKVSVPLPQGVTSVDSLTLTTGNMVYNKATLVLSKPVMGPSGEHEVGSLIAIDNDWDKYSRTGEITVKNVEVKDNVATTYIYVLPTRSIYYNDYPNGNLTNGWEDLPYIQPSFVMYSGDDVYASTVGFYNKEPQAGKTYRLSSDVLKLVPFDNEANADGQNVPYEIANADQMYSFMLRSKSNMRNKYGNNYRACNYVLTDNIVLDKDIPWTPIYYTYWGYCFDGNGKTISGKLIYKSSRTSDFGFFGGIGGCTVKNLTMATDIESNDFCDWLGMITPNAWNCTIENCHVTGNINARAHVVGGLVCYAQNGAQIIGCSSTGIIGNDTRNIYFLESVTMGGIVGLAYDNPSITGCYSTAKFKVEGIASPTSYHGGILGHTENVVYCKPTITGCWASVPMEIEELSSDHILYFGGIGASISGTIQHSYWDEDIATYITCDTNTTVENCGSFTGGRPTAAQIADMNAAILNSGYQYDANGLLHKDRSTTINPFETEKW